MKILFLRNLFFFALEQNCGIWHKKTKFIFKKS